MKCSIALERVRSDIGEDTEHLWKDRELYYYLNKGMYKLTNDIKIEEELTTQVTACTRVALLPTVTEVVQLLAQQPSDSEPNTLRMIPMNELEDNTEYSIWDNFIYFGDTISTVANGLIIRCFVTPDPIITEDGALIDANRELGYCAGYDGNAAYSGFPEQFAIGLTSYAVAQAAKREADFTRYALEMNEFNDAKRIWDQRERSAPGWIDNTWYGR